MRERQKEQVSISAFSMDGSYANARHATVADITTITEAQNAPLARAQVKSATNLKSH